MWFLALFVSSGAVAQQAGSSVGNVYLSVAGEYSLLRPKALEGRGIPYYGGYETSD